MGHSQMGLPHLSFKERVLDITINIEMILPTGEDYDFSVEVGEDVWHDLSVLEQHEFVRDKILQQLDYKAYATTRVQVV